MHNFEGYQPVSGDGAPKNPPKRKSAGKKNKVITKYKYNPKKNMNLSAIENSIEIEDLILSYFGEADTLTFEEIIKLIQWDYGYPLTVSLISVSKIFNQLVENGILILKEDSSLRYFSIYNKHPIMKTKVKKEIT